MTRVLASDGALPDPFRRPRKRSGVICQPRVTDGPLIGCAAGTGPLDHSRPRLHRWWPSHAQSDGR